MYSLKPLFDVQRKLMERIELEHPLQPGERRQDKKVIALFVEFGELLQEWRGFKFWSNDQQPRTKKLKFPAMMEEDKVYINPMLDEYVDGIHFLLEYGIDHDLEHFADEVDVYKEDSVLELVIHILSNMSLLAFDDSFYSDVFNAYLGLGEMLGFTWDEVEKAYMEKNKVNIERQDAGY